MSRTSSPAPDAASPAEHSPTSPNHDNSQQAEETPESDPITSEAAHDSQANDASASRSASESPSTSSPETSAAFNSTSTFASVSTAAPESSWQAVWSPAHNAYYFYNSVTHETTWVNPLQPDAEAGPSNVHNDSASSSDATQAPGASSSQYDIYAAAAEQGIDPALAHLDPSLATSGTAPGAFTYTAKFNSRTGAFARPDARDPTHLSEYERAKRMSEFYFDVNAWEHEVEKRKLEEAQEEESRKRKKPTKKDLDRFREQKRQKKLAKTAWLRT
ncbi:hypothetical protein C8Q74DRAFT_1203624 [Fomes fomentarius]|nr:hypothetical protein C8Q74DRAFT_1203624 [Fomes fomentarius]